MEFIGKLPKIGIMTKRGLRPLLGTDNVALVEPNPWEEMKLLRVIMAGTELRPIEILKMATSWAWSWGLGYVISEGAQMRGLAMRIGYENLSMDYVHDYVVTRISTKDITYMINGQEVIEIK